MCELCELLNSDRVIVTDATVSIVSSQSAAPAVMIIPKQHGALSELPKAVQQHLFTTANTLSALIFDTMEVHGTNILASDGEHSFYTVVGRKEQDNLELMWKPSKAAAEELAEVAKRVQEEAWYIGKEKPKSEVIVAKKEIVPDDHAPKEGETAQDVAADIQKTVHEGPTDKHNYLIRQLTRRR